MSIWADLVGTILNSFRLGLTGPLLKNNAGVIENRNNLDTLFAIVRGASPLGANDLVTKAYYDANTYFTANWAVPDWYLDKIIGNNANNGTSALTPLRDAAELRRRVGPYALWSNSVTIHILSNGITDSLVLSGCFSANYRYLDVIGTATITAGPFAVDTVTLPDVSLDKVYELTATGIADWTPYIGYRLRITSGIYRGMICWICAANPKNHLNVGPGVSTARTTEWRAFDGSTVTPDPGSPFVLESGFSPVPNIELHLDGVLDDDGSIPQVDQRMWTVTNIATRVLQVTCVANDFAQRGFAFGCELEILQITHWQNTNLLSPDYLGPAQACKISTFNSPVLNGSLLLNDKYTSCLIADSNEVFIERGDIATVQGWTVFENASINVLGTLIIDGAGTFDNPNDGINCYPLSELYIVDNLIIIAEQTGLNTQENSSIEAYLANAVCWSTASFVNCRLTVTSGAYSVTFPSLPTLLQPNDYAQHGKASLTPLAGYIDITVGQWSPTHQVVTVSYDTLSGSSVGLTVPSAFQSSTSFRVTGKSLSDTSSFTWSMSPIGAGTKFVSHL
jgi:hypothetical protein